MVLRHLLLSRVAPEPQHETPPSEASALLIGGNARATGDLTASSGSVRAETIERENVTITRGVAEFDAYAKSSPDGQVSVAVNTYAEPVGYDFVITRTRTIYSVDDGSNAVSGETITFVRAFDFHRLEGVTIEKEINFTRIREPTTKPLVSRESKVSIGLDELDQVDIRGNLATADSNSKVVGSNNLSETDSFAAAADTFVDALSISFAGLDEVDGDNVALATADATAAGQNDEDGLLASASTVAFVDTISSHLSADVIIGA